MREIKRGDIYKADLSPVVGSEQGGIRPVVIVQNDMGNRYSPTIIVVPITTRQNKKPLPTHTKLKCKCLLKESMALMEQVRTIDKSRLIEFIGVLNKDEMNNITEALRISIDLRELKSILDETGYILKFSDELFLRVVKAIHVQTNGYILFELKCGLKLKERAKWE